jgi:hypothetical protein
MPECYLCFRMHEQQYSPYCKPCGAWYDALNTHSCFWCVFQRSDIMLDIFRLRRFGQTWKQIIANIYLLGLLPAALYSVRFNQANLRNTFVNHQKTALIHYISAQTTVFDSLLWPIMVPLIEWARRTC